MPHLALTYAIRWRLDEASYTPYKAIKAGINIARLNRFFVPFIILGGYVIYKPSLYRNIKSNKKYVKINGTERVQSTKQRGL